MQARIFNDVYQVKHLNVVTTFAQCLIIFSILADKFLLKALKHSKQLVDNVILL